MDNDKKIDKSSEQKNMPWASALDGAMTMSSWLVGPLIVGFLVGSYFDNKYLTGGHKYLYICLGLAFLLTIVGLVTEVMKFVKWTSYAEATKVTSSNTEATADKSSNSKAENTGKELSNVKTITDKSSSTEASKVTSDIVEAKTDKSTNAEALDGKSQLNIKK